MIPAGNLYIADRDNNRIRRVGPDGNIVTVAGTGVAGNSGDGGFAVQAELNGPSSVTVDGAGNLYIADTGNQTHPQGHARRQNLRGGELGDGDAGICDHRCVGKPVHRRRWNGQDPDRGKQRRGSDAVERAASPRGLALDSLGNLYYTEGGAARVSRRSSTGGITSVGSGWSIPRAVAVDASGIVYVADPGLQQVLAVESTGMASTGMTPSGTVTVIAGTGAAGFSGDGGTATAAQLDFPWDVAVGANGVVVVADLENNRVRALTPPVTPPSQTQTPPPAPLTGSVTVVNAASLTPGPVTAGMLLLIGGTGLSPTRYRTRLWRSVPTRG